MTAIAGLLSGRDRRRLAERLAELRDLDRTMRQRVSVASAPVPVPLHRMGAARGERENQDRKTGTEGKRP